jgi:hypothetical protein
LRRQNCFLIHFSSLLSFHFFSFLILGHLLPNDPGRWSIEDRSKFGTDLKSLFSDIEESDENWECEAGWEMQKMDSKASDGWHYGNSFTQEVWDNSKGHLTFCRRRKWVRALKRKPNQTSNLGKLDKKINVAIEAEEGEVQASEATTEAAKSDQDLLSKLTIS